MSTQPTPEDSRIVQQRWRGKMCPITDAIMHGDGRMALYGLPDLGATKLPLQARPDVVSTVTKWIQDHGDNWAWVNQLCSVPIPDRGFRVLAGEGSYGGDGFVAACNASDGALVWAAFFTESNPFVEVSSDGSHVLAVSNLGTVWRFSLDDPELIIIG